MSFVAFIQENVLLFALAAGVLGAIITLEFRSFQTRGADLGTAGLSQAVNAGAILVDLRRHDDYRAGHIAGAKNIPFEELGKQLNSLNDKDGGKSASIVFYCYSGSFSAKAVAQLRKDGYTDVKHLKGGIAAWNTESLPVASKG